MRATLRPLSEIERQVAEENLAIVDRYLAANRLPRDDWWNVVIFRYLLSVENWFRRPELWQLSFSTVAWKAMQSAVDCEKKKQRRRIKTISIDEVLPGTECLTYADTVTEENLNYIHYLTEVR